MLHNRTAQGSNELRSALDQPQPLNEVAKLMSVPYEKLHLLLKQEQRFETRVYPTARRPISVNGNLYTLRSVRKWIEDIRLVNPKILRD